MYGLILQSKPINASIILNKVYTLFASYLKHNFILELFGGNFLWLRSNILIDINFHTQIHLRRYFR